MKEEEIKAHLIELKSKLDNGESFAEFPAGQAKAFYIALHDLNISIQLRRDAEAIDDGLSRRSTIDWEDVMKLPIIPHDKLSHYFIGSVLGCIGCLLYSWSLGVLLCTSFAFGKEVYDKTSKTGKPEFLDFVWTMAGGFVPCLISYLG